MGILRMSMGARGRVMGRVVALVVAMAALGAVGAARASADVTYPARPTDRGAGGFIADEAKLIGDADAVKIRAICEKLLTEKRVPLLVCTVTSMADHVGGGASGWTIERYAMNVFDEWGVGAKQYDYGILLLVSKGDRKARIELGAGWTRERDAACANIMSMDMVPAFKRGDYSGGILKGVQQLDALARVASKPAPPMEQGGAGNTTATPAGANVPAPQGRMADPNAASDDGQSQQYSYSNSYPRSGRTSGGGGLGGLSLGCLAIPVIGVFMVLRVIKGALGWGGGGGSGWGRSMYPGGYGRGYGGGWGSGSSFGGGGWGGSGGGGSSSGGGGGFSGGSFGGGSSGGGGASGSW